MIRVLVALCSASLLAAVATTAFAATAGTKSVQLSKVVLDTETSELMARVKGGTLCVFPSKVKIPKEKKTQDYERFDNLFTTGMKASGYTVVSTSSEMFADGEQDKGDYLVGVTLRPAEFNLCSSVAGEKGDMSVNAEWQVFDRAAGKVVETATTTGKGVQAKFAADGQKQILNDAFNANLAALLKTGVLRKYLAEPATQPPLSTATAAGSPPTSE
jgi:hypothetical protein